MHEKGDWEAATFALKTLGTERADLSAGRDQAISRSMFIAGWGGYPLIGTKEQVVDGLETLSAMGIDGVLLSWPRYEEGMREFRDATYPLLVQSGLRGKA